MLKQNAFGLLDVKKIQSMEKQHHSWSTNEMRADLQAFTIFENLQKSKRLAKGLFMECTMHKRIQELQEVCVLYWIPHQAWLWSGLV